MNHSQYDKQKKHASTQHVRNNPTSPERKRKPQTHTATRTPQRARQGSASSSRHATRQSQQKPTGVFAVLDAIGSLLLALLYELAHIILKGLKALARAFAFLAKKSKVAAIVVVIACVVVVAGGIDSLAHANKFYDGVHISGVDVSGMTTDEAKAAVEGHYQQLFDGEQAIIYADDDIAKSVNSTEEIKEGHALDEQLSFEEARKNKKAWLVEASALAPQVDTEQAVGDAFHAGRTGFLPFSIIDRIDVKNNSRNYEASISLEPVALDQLGSDIDTAIGDPRVDWSIAIEQGKAVAIEGHDGHMVNRDWLQNELVHAFSDKGDEPASFVATVEYAPVQVDKAMAEATCKAVNELVSKGADFTFDGETLEVKPETLATWVAFDTQTSDGTTKIVPSLDHKVATSSMVSLVNERATGASGSYTITLDGEQPMVHLQSEMTVPLLSEALSTLDNHLFDAYRTNGDVNAHEGEPIAIATQQVSGDLPLDDAYNYGIVTEMASFTTPYVDSPATENRNHNIHLVSDIINNSITPSGETWSFNNTAGNCNEEAGFLPAGAISAGDYVDEPGGGICQVATTVFNAAYEAGLPIGNRMNHTLYMASYPAGRDAAVSYPELDFTWINDTTSDILLQATYTDTTITITLYGIDTGYSVTTETGQWEEGEKHSTRTEIDETLAPGTSYTKTAGTDGLKISVIRTVTNRKNEIVRQDTFDSEYAPITEVIVEGPQV